MPRYDRLKPFRPQDALNNLEDCDCPAIVLDGLQVQRALSDGHRRLLVFEIPSVALLAKGLLRAAMEKEAVVGVACRPTAGFDPLHFHRFATRLFHACGEIGFRHPLVLSAGPFPLDERPSQAAASTFAASAFAALKAGFADISVAVASAVTDEAKGALAPVAAYMAERGMLLEIVASSPDSAARWRAAVADMGVSQVLISTADPVEDRSAPGAFHGFRPASGEFPDDEEAPEGFAGRFDRMTGDPLAEIALQVLDEESAAKVEELSSPEGGGMRVTDALASMADALDDTPEESVQWVEENAYYFALDLLESEGCAGTAKLVLSSLVPDADVDEDPVARLEEFMKEEGVS